MLTVLLRRVLGSFVLLAAISLVAFGLARALPGDPAEAILGFGSNPALLAQVRTQLGIDRPWSSQYLHWAGHALVGDLGVSLATTGAAQGMTGQSVAGLIGQGLRVTLPITLLGTALAVLLGVPLGLISAIRPGGAVDRVVSAVSVLGLSVPSFYLAYLLILVFSVRLGWLPSVGFVSPADSAAGFLRSVALPVATIGLVNATPVARAARAASVEALGSPSIALLRLRGAPPSVIILKHVLRNALLPIVTVIGLQVGYLLGGVIVIENMFAIPGMGRQLLIAAEQRDYPTLQALIVVFGGCFVLVNLIVDLLYMAIDPRTRPMAQ